MSQVEGLVLFCLVLTVDVAALAYDRIILALGLPSVTEVCRSFPAAAVLVISVQAFGIVGLSFHFFRKG